jgi:hypothetical protein
MVREISFKTRLNYWVGEAQITKLNEIAERLGLDKSEIARRAMALGLRKFEHARLPGSPKRHEPVDEELA